MSKNSQILGGGFAELILLKWFIVLEAFVL